MTLAKLDRMLALAAECRRGGFSPTASVTSTKPPPAALAAARELLATHAELMAELDSEPRPTPAMLAYARAARLDVSKLWPEAR